MNRDVCEHFTPIDLHCDHCADKHSKLRLMRCPIFTCTYPEGECQGGCKLHTCPRCGKRGPAGSIHTCTPAFCRRCDAPATHGDLCDDCLTDYGE